MVQWGGAVVRRRLEVIAPELTSWAQRRGGAAPV
jgi:hypothetical protein